VKAATIFDSSSEVAAPYRKARSVEEIRTIKIAPGVYRINGFDVTKVAKNCWRITSPGCGQDFISLGDASYWCKNGGSLYPPSETDN